MGVSLIDRFHERRGFVRRCGSRVYHIGYHYLVLRDGRIEPGRPESCEGAHAGNRSDNLTFLGIALVGNFDSQSNPGGRFGSPLPTDAQVRSVIHLVAALARKYRFGPESVLGHYERRTGTACPGDRFPLERVRAAIGSQEVISRATSDFDRADAPDAVGGQALLPVR